jgi:glycosyltransferase involved in cell wall biosynthesis
MKVRFIPKTDDTTDPVRRLRCDVIIKVLRRDGLDIGYYRENEQADVLVIGSTEFDKYLPIAEEHKRAGRSVVFDLPENELRRTAKLNKEKVKGVLGYIHNPIEVLKRFRAHMRRKGFDEKLEKMIRLSDCITVGSEDTLSYVKAYNRNCKVIFEPLDNNFPRSPKHHNNKASSIVWVGMAVNFMYIEEIKEVLQPLMKETGVSLKIITSPDLFKIRPKLLHGNPIEIEFIPWQLDTLWNELLDADIGIAPLFRYTWKSPNKVVTYWGAGLPVVASPSKSYSQIITHGEDGLIASDVEDWGKSLSVLIDDPGLRNSLGKRGYQKAVSNFSIEKISGHWKQLFERLIRERDT